MKEVLCWNFQDFKTQIQELQLDPKPLRLTFVHLHRGDAWIEEYAQLTILTKTSDILVYRFPSILYLKYEKENPKRKEYESGVVEKVRDAFGFEPIAGEWEE